MDQDFFFNEINLIIMIVSGLGGVIVFMLSKKFNDIQDRIINLERKLDAEVKDLYKEQKRSDRENSDKHKELSELVKKIEIHFGKIESKIEMIGQTVCDGKWKHGKA